ncbi:MAG: helicase C-terminal domain-containing protein, partial [Akkermansia sp.]
SLRFALENERKAVISTHTINLQEQLFHKDIPTVQKALGMPFKAALLKGRGNYLCITRLNRAMAQMKDLFNQDEAKQLHDLFAWSRDCGEGSLAELPRELEISPKVWAQVCSENHVCTPRNCGPACPYQAARLRVQEAQVVVLNHTLFFGLLALADLTQSEEMERMPGFIFPNDFLILDEGHTIETVAANQLGISVVESELKYELYRLYNKRTHKGSLKQYATPRMLQYVDDAQMAADEFFEIARTDCNLDENRGTVRLRQGGWTEDLLSPALEVLEREIKEALQLVENDLSRSELMDMAGRLLAYRKAVGTMVSLEEEGYVYWVESSGAEGKYMTMRAALIDVAELLQEKLFDAERALILTSATLATTGDDMSHFIGRVGAWDVETLKLGSPFDFATQMRVVAARSMPPPPARDGDEEEYHHAMAWWIEKALLESQGRAFVLFTSYALMRAMEKHIRPFCIEQGWNLFMQGESLTRSQMIEQFKQDVDSVLFGTESFWTGVDVPGEALSNVIITKIPFESPSNPLTEARCEAIAERGGKPFFHYSLPEAILKFRQGVGRLIRSKSDKGMVVLLDARITNKPYGLKFMQALPEEAPREFY